MPQSRISKRKKRGKVQEDHSGVLGLEHAAVSPLPVLAGNDCGWSGDSGEEGNLA